MVLAHDLYWIGARLNFVRGNAVPPSAGPVRGRLRGRRVSRPRTISNAQAMFAVRHSSPEMGCSRLYAEAADGSCTFVGFELSCAGSTVAAGGQR